METNNDQDIYIILFIIFAVFMAGFMTAKAIYEP